ncbi:MAG: hypothetical protein K2P13_03785 [Lachnospiraceae bacterium]|nr:hypothetical protein [Lachnospiraceae bacterium]
MNWENGGYRKLTIETFNADVTAKEEITDELVIRKNLLPAIIKKNTGNEVVIISTAVISTQV